VQIAIIGCGIAGQAAAIGLSRNGHKTTLFERFPVARPVGAGLLLQPSGLTALAHLGLLPEVLAAGARIARLHGRNARGKTVMDIAYARWRDTAAFGVGIHRSSLFDVLHTELKRTDVALRLGFDVARVENPERPVLVGRDGEREGPFDMVIVTAGAHDCLREIVSPACPAPLYPWGALWTTCADPERKFPDTLQQVYDGAHKMAGVLPIGTAKASHGDTPLVAFFWSLKHADYDAVRMSGLDALKMNVARLWPDAAELLDQAEDFGALALATYRDVRPRRIFKERVILLGDAAHGTSPQLGQGANLALIDAVTLTTLMAQNADIDAAFKKYVRVRRCHTWYYQLASRAITPAFQSDSKVYAALRDLLFPLVCRMPVSSAWTHRTLTGYAQLGVGRWRPNYPC